MSTSKIVSLLVYAVLGVLAITMADSAVGLWSGRFLILLAIVHSIEVLVFFKACREAGGSLGLHLLNKCLLDLIEFPEFSIVVFVQANDVKTVDCFNRL